MLYDSLFSWHKIKVTNIFKVPEIPKKAVPEDRVPVAVPRKLEPPPERGTCL